MKKLFLSLILISSLTSCIETIALGSLVGSKYVMREKSLSDTKNDVVIASKVSKSIKDSNLETDGNIIDIIVDEQRVLLIGLVKSSKIAIKAKDLAWKIAGVKEVIDEIQVISAGTKFNRFYIATQDSITTSQIRTRALFAKNASTLNVKMKTVNGVVYLIGVSKNQDITNLTRVIATTRGVRKVVSHVIRINDKRRRA